MVHETKNAAVEPLADARRANLLTQHAFVSGITGGVVIVASGYLAHTTGAIKQGWPVLGRQLTTDNFATPLAVLFACALLMVAVDVAVRWSRERRGFVTVSPLILQGSWGAFLLECVINFALHLAFFRLVMGFFHLAPEYGYTRTAPYYQSWFSALDCLWQAYLWAGLPYVIATRALQHDEQLDRKEPAHLLRKVLLRVIPHPGRGEVSFGEADKIALLGVMVKMFFVPLMTVFFWDNFQHMVRNWGYLLDQMLPGVASGSYTHKVANRDLVNLSMSLIFSVDVGVAWCGYAVSSRWARNGAVSVEPTVLGWLVAVACYPPFRNYLSIYAPIPAERSFLAWTNQWVVSLFAAMSISSYLVYMASTLMLGIRFSNLTHRGLVTRGPYAVVRHPAYAAKNFSWWCVMMPSVLGRALRKWTGINWTRGKGPALGPAGGGWNKELEDPCVVRRGSFLQLWLLGKDPKGVGAVGRFAVAP